MDLVRTSPPAAHRFITPQRAVIHRIAYRLAPLLFEAGRAESLLMKNRLAGVRVESPVYITGLARAGSTLLLEALTACPHTASHRYHDFPWMPAIATRRRFVRHFARSAAAVERSHADGLMVTPASPEAFEETLWRHFFPALRKAQCPVLDDLTDNAPFDDFYRNHIKKLLVSENATRYIAKGNDLAGRIGYLLRLFPDAIIVIAVREPQAHVASLIKQHRWFCEQQKRNPALLEYMNRSAHHEFGLGRRAPLLGDEAAMRAVTAAWEEGDDLKAYALYWNHVYTHLLPWRDHPNIHLVRYEALCRHPAATLEALWSRCRLAPAPTPPAIAAPRYYQARFTGGEPAVLRRITQDTAAALGYEIKS
jgi:hypothetical protein